ncbi:hypothetical protein WOLCODRAFT_114406 [Wolfiporia cocos MD-104 SS10]|uniref:TAP42-like protein n=1 Tax=Wolfiporia cocos (strain MD-104) TaxID=742152 RepID=A0A2H3J8E7_WOLCO|nr:hypothetical protein WOLCODRAFT_114406 [Wolfiporia cocos MD-104 SS10]
MSNSELPLPALFHQALTKADKSYNLPTIDDETQGLIQSALTDLRLVHSRISALSLFSENETLSDIATRDLVYLLVPFVLSEVEGRVRTTDAEERLEKATRSQIQRILRRFLSSLETYEIVSESEKALYAPSATSTTDARTRRELKIKQYQKEKEIRTRIEEVRKRRNHGAPVGECSSDFALIASVLPDLATLPAGDEDDTDTEDILRDATLLLLRLTYAQAHAQLQSLNQELQLLRSTPPSHPSLPAEDLRHAKAREQDDMWRLDQPQLQGGPDGKGPLLDPSGKPLRPFTILPSSASRAELQAQVFRPDHRLPTMSIDEYLEIEYQRGNIISGGGPQSEATLTTKEQLTLDSEMDGTVYGEEKAEEKRQQDEKWAQYTDTHPRGAGNTMNRG